MTHPDALLADIQRWLAERVAAGDSLRQLAIKAELSDPALLRFSEPDWNPTIKTLRKLSALRDSTSLGKQVAA